MVKYNATAWDAAHERFLTDAKALTDQDLAQFAIVDPELAERARAKRGGYVPQRSAPQRKADAEPATIGGMAGIVNDVVLPILSTYRHKIDLLEQEIARLQKTLDLAGTALDDQRTAVNYLLLERKPAVAA